VQSEVASKHPENLDGPEQENNEPFLSKERLNRTMLREYLSWVGLFTTSKDGISLLREFKITDHLQALIDSNGQYDHFCQIILQSMEYGFVGPTRQLLESWIYKSSPNLAKYITEIFRNLFRSGLNDFSQWCMQFLYQMVISSNEEVSQSAFSVLEEVCCDPSSMKYFLDRTRNS